MGGESGEEDTRSLHSTAFAASLMCAVQLRSWNHVEACSLNNPPTVLLSISRSGNWHVHALTN